MCFPATEACEGAFSYTLHQSPSVTLVCVGGESVPGEDASTYCYGESTHTRWISSTTCLTRVTDEHKVCNGVRSRLSAEEMSKQIYLWRRPQVLIARSIFCNSRQSARAFQRHVYYVCMNRKQIELYLCGGNAVVLALCRVWTVVFSCSCVSLVLSCCLPLPAVAWQGDADSF